VQDSRWRCGYPPGGVDVAPEVRQQRLLGHSKPPSFTECQMILHSAPRELLKLCRVVAGSLKGLLMVLSLKPPRMPSNKVPSMSPLPSLLTGAASWSAYK
jgi:hypothetical protein